MSSDKKDLITTPKVESLTTEDGTFYKKTDWKGNVLFLTKEQNKQAKSYEIDKLREGETINNKGQIIKDYKQETKELFEKQAKGEKLTENERKQIIEDVLTSEKQTKNNKTYYQQVYRDINAGTASTNEDIKFNPQTGRYEGNLYIPSRSTQEAKFFLTNDQIVNIAGNIKYNKNSYEANLPNLMIEDPYGFKSSSHEATKRLKDFFGFRRALQPLEGILNGNYRIKTPEGEKSYAKEAGYTQHSYGEILSKYGKDNITGLWTDLYVDLAPTILQILKEKALQGVGRDEEIDDIIHHRQEAGDTNDQEKLKDLDLQLDSRLLKRVLLGTGSEENTKDFLNIIQPIFEGLNRAHNNKLYRGLDGEIDFNEQKYLQLYEQLKTKYSGKRGINEYAGYIGSGEDEQKENQALSTGRIIKDEQQKTEQEKQEEIKAKFEKKEKKEATIIKETAKLVNQTSQIVSNNSNEEITGGDNIGIKKGALLFTGLVGLLYKAFKTAWRMYGSSYYAKLAGDRTGYFKRQLQGVFSIYTTYNAMKEEDNWHYKSRGEMELTGLEQGDGLLQYIGGSSTMTKEQKNKLADNFIKRKQMTPLQARAFKRRLHLEQQDSAEKGIEDIKNGIITAFQNVAIGQEGLNSDTNIYNNTNITNTTEQDINISKQDINISNNISNNVTNEFGAGEDKIAQIQTDIQQQMQEQQIKEQQEPVNRTTKTSKVEFNKSNSYDDLKDVLQSRIRKVVQDYITNR